MVSAQIPDHEMMMWVKDKYNKNYWMLDRYSACSPSVQKSTILAYEDSDSFKSDQIYSKKIPIFMVPNKYHWSNHGIYLHSKPTWRHKF
jgi:hypothetical protein